MIHIDWFPWFLTALSLIGVVLNIRHRHEGFYFWVVANIGWVWIAWQKEIPAQMLLFTIYTFLAFWGLWEWRKAPKK